MSERIVMAAWKEGEAIYAVERPGRHHSVIHAMVATGRVSTANPLACDSGFITSQGRYVGRKEAMQIAECAGQVLRYTGPKHTLFSEDMW